MSSLSRIGAVCACLAALPMPAHAGPDFAHIEIKTHAVRGPIHMLEGAGGNIGVSTGPDGVLIIDDQFAPLLATKIRAALKRLGSDTPTFVLNTHWHGDHTGGNEAFGKDAVIVAHDNVRARLSTVQALPRKTFPARPEVAWPEVTFDDDLTLHFNGEAIRVQHHPAAHTDGDATVYFTGSKVLHAGDLFFNERFPFVDVQSGGTVAGVIAAVERLLAWLPADARVIPGHGPLSDVAGLRTYLKMLTTTRDLVKRRIADGLDTARVVAAGVPKAYASYTWTFVNTAAWLELLDASYRPKAR